jgi:DNA replication protein DnaC
MTTPCLDCSQPFEPKILEVLGVEVFRQRYCPDCIATQETKLTAHWAAERVAVTSARDAAWEALCDAEYRTTAEGGSTDLQRLAKDCPKLAEITAFPEFGKGLIIQGPTDRCKTRAAWRLLHRVHVSGGKIRALTGGDFGREFADAAGKHYRKEWFEGLVGATVFFLDDLGKSKWTPAVWGEFFEVIEARGSRCKPSILTTNDDNATLGKKAADPVLWEPLLRRLREFKLVKA